MVLRLSKPLAASPHRARGIWPTFARPAGGRAAARLAQSGVWRLGIAMLPALLGLSMPAGPAVAEPAQISPRAAPKAPAAGAVDRVGTKRERGPEPATRNSTKAVEPRRKRQPVAPTSANEVGKSKATPAHDKEVARPAPPPPAPVPASTGSDGAPAAQAWSQAEIIEALQSCLKALGPVVAEIEAQAPLRAGDCGAAAPVTVAAVGAHPRVEVRPPPTLNCAVAGRLSRWMEDVVQPAARKLIGAPVVKMLNVSGYQCRNRNGASGPASKTSEHAFANAIDVGAFELANGRRVDVGADWGPTERDLLEARRQESAAADSPPGPQRPPAAGATGEQQAQPQRGKKDGAAKTARADRADPADRSGSAATGSAGGERTGTPTTTAPRELTPAARFLRQVHAGACGPFGTVLGPEANEAHRDHLHLDLAPRKRSAFCE